MCFVTGELNHIPDKVNTLKPKEKVANTLLISVKKEAAVAAAKVAAAKAKATAAAEEEVRIAKIWFDKVAKARQQK